MAKKTFNEKGFEVSRGFQNITFYRAAPCDLLLVINPTNFAETIEEFRQSPFTYYSGIRVENIYELGFLDAFPSLLYLEISTEKPVDLTVLKCLHNLRGIQISDPKNGLNFQNHPHLEVFTGKWHEDNMNLDKCRDLRFIRISNFNSKAKDFSKLKNIVRLENLEIIRTNIEMLNGIETLKDLKYLMIAYASKLKDISAISSSNLKEIEFDVLKKIQDYRPLGNIKYLRKLIISNCSDMQDINWIENLNLLDFISFVDTKIIDGNLSPLLQIPELRYVGTFDKVHYNLKEHEINKHLLEKHKSK